MSLRFITGGSGQGKTSFIIDDLIRRSMAEPSRLFYLIVPEQFSLEMQRRLAQAHPDHGYMNIDVLSFYRLAYRVFDECGYQPEDILEDLGVAMVLRRILADHPQDLPELRKNRRQEGFLDELKSVLMEFISYGVSHEDLNRTGQALSDHPGLSRKCGELARVYDYFEESIKGRFMVTEQILDRLCDFTADSDLLAGAVFYFDGFTGFTPVQLAFLQELLPWAGELNIAVTIPAAGGCLPLKSQEDLFHFSEKTIDSLIKICQASGEELEDPVCLDHACPPRFLDNPELAHLERGIFRTVREPYGEKPESIHGVSCLHPDQEAEYILHKIEYLVRKEKYRYRDIAVLTGDLEEYSACFERQARLTHIPLFIDNKKKMSYHPSIETIRALFQLVQRDYSYESVFRYLKSGMTDMDEEDIDRLENYILASGVRGYRMWSQPFKRRMQDYSQEEADRLDGLRRQVLEETETFYLAWKEPGSTVRDRMKALYELMCHLNYGLKLEAMARKEEREGNYVREKEYREIFSLLVVLLDKIVDIFGDECLPVRDLSELVDAGMESLGLGVLPLSADQLILGDLKRTRLADIKVLFIAGFNDGLIPPAIREGGLLSKDDKEILSDHGIVLAHGPEEQSLEDEFYMYLAFARPKDAIYFSWSDLGRDGKGRQASPVLQDLKVLFPDLEIRSYPAEEKRYYFNADDSREYLVRTLSEVLGASGSRGDNDSGSQDLSRAQTMLLGYWMRHANLHGELARYFDVKKRQGNPRTLTKDLAAALYGMELAGSVTRLEKYAACPFQYFCIYGMGLYERDIYGVSALDVGNLFHKALEFFSNEVRESDYRWKTMPDAYVEDLLDQSVNAALGEGAREAFLNTARDQYRIRSVRRILDRTVRIIRSQLADSDLEPDSFELHFGKADKLDCAVLPLEGGGRMALNGLIDRVDVFEDEDSVLIRVVDYKSGKRAFDMDDLYHGLQLQLVLYMRAAREIYGRKTGKDVVPAGMYYYELKDPILKSTVDKPAKVEKEFKMSGYTNSDPEVLDRIERDTQDFRSAAVTLKKEGLPNARSKVLNEEEFQLLEDYVEVKVRQMGQSIYEGDIDARPYYNYERTGCSWCAYRSVCGFDSKETGYRNRWKKMKDQDVLDAIRKQVE